MYVKRKQAPVAHRVLGSIAFEFARAGGQFDFMRLTIRRPWNAVVIQQAANNETAALGHVPNGPESLAGSLVRMPSDQDLYRSQFHIDRERRWLSGN